MNKRSVVAMLAAVCLVVAAPGLIGQAKTQQTPANQTVNPVARPDGVLKARCDLVAVSIEFVDLKSFDSGSSKHYSCKPAYTFKNEGPQPSGTFDVVFEIQDPVTKAWNFYLTMAYQASLAPGETRRFGGQPVDQCIWAAGAERPKFRLRLDFNHLVTESNEDNNDLVRQVSLMELRRLADLPLRKLKTP